MKKPVIVALCCLLALSTGTAAFAEEPTPCLLYTSDAADD